MEHVFRQWISMHRAMIAWFHAAHHCTKGIGFAGDHVNIYGRMYLDLEGDFDGLIEKCMGLTNDETLANPMSILSLAANLLAKYPTPSDRGAEETSYDALEIIKSYIEYLEQVHRQLENTKYLTLGLVDMISVMANNYETFVYLLQQRNKAIVCRIPEN